MSSIKTKLKICLFLVQDPVQAMLHLFGVSVSLISLRLRLEDDSSVLLSFQNLDIFEGYKPIIVEDVPPRRFV